ncbi:BrnT family toxin [Candidatus Spongiihabitans sp.]|uniref:BrnT family toxin n=1 Tax=Candidatus Spongiihabitans sp. TaxID=3101308 RepID=UPI003C7E6698
MPSASFEWDEGKDRENQKKHEVSFHQAQYAFADENRVIAEDGSHSQHEKRYFCFGMNRDGTGVLTVRFTYRHNRIRILGAGYWRRGKKIYEKANPVR